MERVCLKCPLPGVLPRVSTGILFFLITIHIFVLNSSLSCEINATSPHLFVRVVLHGIFITILWLVMHVPFMFYRSNPLYAPQCPVQA